MGKGDKISKILYNDWVNIVDKVDVGVSSIMKDEIKELKKEIEQIKEKQQKSRKIIIKVR